MLVARKRYRKLTLPFDLLLVRSGREEDWTKVPLEDVDSVRDERPDLDIMLCERCCLGTDEYEFRDIHLFT